MTLECTLTADTYAILCWGAGWKKIDIQVPVLMGEQNKTGAGGPRPGFRDACAVGFKLLGPRVPTPGLRSCSVIRRGGGEWGLNLILFCRLDSGYACVRLAVVTSYFFFFQKYVCQRDDLVVGATFAGGLWL